MKNETVNALKGLFDAYDNRQLTAQKQQARAKTEHELFLGNFDKLVLEIIRPTMEELSALIKSRGHHCEITYEPETHNSREKSTAARVKMEIHPSQQLPRYVPPGEIPTLSFSAETYGDKIWTHVSTMMPGRGGSSGKHNEYTLESVTRETVENEVMHLLTGVFGR
ncbi:MAG: hypothetical protein ACLQVL_15170 [Terriglobia bacterium]